MSVFVFLMAFLAALFNPLFPVYFSRLTWAFFDAFGVFVFGVHWALFHDANNSN
jgi:hypothetical protein